MNKQLALVDISDGEKHPSLIDEEHFPKRRRLIRDGVDPAPLSQQLPALPGPLPSGWWGDSDPLSKQPPALQTPLPSGWKAFAFSCGATFFQSFRGPNGEWQRESPVNLTGVLEESPGNDNGPSHVAIDFKSPQPGKRTSSGKLGQSGEKCTSGAALAAHLTAKNSTEKCAKFSRSGHSANTCTTARNAESFLDKVADDASKTAQGPADANSNQLQAKLDMQKQALVTVASSRSSKSLADADRAVFWECQSPDCKTSINRIVYKDDARRYHRKHNHIKSKGHAEAATSTDHSEKTPGAADLPLVPLEQPSKRLFKKSDPGRWEPKKKSSKLEGNDKVAITESQGNDKVASTASRGEPKPVEQLNQKQQADVATSARSGLPAPLQAVTPPLASSSRALVSLPVASDSGKVAGAVRPVFYQCQVPGCKAASYRTVYEDDSSKTQHKSLHQNLKEHKSAAKVAQSPGPRASRNPKMREEYWSVNNHWRKVAKGKLLLQLQGIDKRTFDAKHDGIPMNPGHWPRFCGMAAGELVYVPCATCMRLFEQYKSRCHTSSAPAQVVPLPSALHMLPLPPTEHPTSAIAGSADSVLVLPPPATELAASASAGIADSVLPLPPPATERAASASAGIADTVDAQSHQIPGCASKDEHMACKEDSDMTELLMKALDEDAAGTSESHCEHLEFALPEHTNQDQPAQQENRELVKTARVILKELKPLPPQEKKKDEAKNEDDAAADAPAADVAAPVVAPANGPQSVDSVVSQAGDCPVPLNEAHSVAAGLGDAHALRSLLKLHVPDNQADSDMTELLLKALENDATGTSESHCKRPEFAPPEHCGQRTNQDNSDQKEEDDAKEKMTEELLPRVLTQTTLDAHLKPGMHPELLPDKACAAKQAKEVEDDDAANFWDSLVDGDEAMRPKQDVSQEGSPPAVQSEEGGPPAVQSKAPAEVGDIHALHSLNKGHTSDGQVGCNVNSDRNGSAEKDSVSSSVAPIALRCIYWQCQIPGCTSPSNRIVYADNKYKSQYRYSHMKSPLHAQASAVASQNSPEGAQGTLPKHLSSQDGQNVPLLQRHRSLKLRREVATGASNKANPPILKSERSLEGMDVDVEDHIPQEPDLEPCTPLEVLMLDGVTEHHQPDASVNDPLPAASSLILEATDLAPGTPLKVSSCHDKQNEPSRTPLKLELGTPLNVPTSHWEPDTPLKVAMPKLEQSEPSQAVQRVSAKELKKSLARTDYSGAITEVRAKCFEKQPPIKAEDANAAGADAARKPPDTINDNACSGADAKDAALAPHLGPLSELRSSAAEFFELLKEQNFKDDSELIAVTGCTSSRWLSNLIRGVYVKMPLPVSGRSAFQKLKKSRADERQFDFAPVYICWQSLTARWVICDKPSTGHKSHFYARSSIESFRPEVTEHNLVWSISNHTNAPNTMRTPSSQHAIPVAYVEDHGLTVTSCSQSVKRELQ